MPYHTPILVCGCGEKFPCDIHTGNVRFEKVCLKCHSEFVISANIPAQYVGSPCVEIGENPYGKTE